MKPTFEFQKKKFCSLDAKQQHKKCAQLLCEVYSEPSNLPMSNIYGQLINWMEADLKVPENREEIADRFHYHLKEACISVKEHNFLPRVETTDKETGQTPLPISIYLDRLRSAHNIGSIIRTTEALRLGTIFFSEAMAEPTHDQVQKTAMGASDWVTCKQHTPLGQLNRPIIALETIPSATAYYDFQFPDTFTLVIGNEEEGCSEATLKTADHFIQIPLYGRKNSLNAACAFAIVAAEIAKQKRRTTEI